MQTGTRLATYNTMQTGTRLATNNSTQTGTWLTTYNTMQTSTRLATNNSTHTGTWLTTYNTMQTGTRLATYMTTYPHNTTCLVTFFCNLYMKLLGQVYKMKAQLESLSVVNQLLCFISRTSNSFSLPRV